MQCDIDTKPAIVWFSISLKRIILDFPVTNSLIYEILFLRVILESVICNFIRKHWCQEECDGQVVKCITRWFEMAAFQ